MAIPIIGNVFELGRQAAIELGVHLFLRDVLKEGATEVGRKVKASLEDCRMDVLTLILFELASIDQVASDALMNEQMFRQLLVPPFVPGDENRFVQILAKARRWAGDDPERLDKLLQILARMGHLAATDRQRFEALLEFLNHDVVWQWFTRGVQYLTATTRTTTRAAHDFRMTLRDTGILRPDPRRGLPPRRWLPNWFRMW